LNGDAAISATGICSDAVHANDTVYCIAYNVLMCR